MYTHCPNCDSHFEITQEYLDIANGKVRCGNCEHIFNALDNLYEEQAEEPVEDDTSAVEQTAQDSGNTTPDEIIEPSPSVNIKERMEQISASLSAATRELKTARESTAFGKPSEDSPFQSSFTATSAELETSHQTTEPEAVEEALDIQKPVTEEKASDIEEPVPADETVDIAESIPAEETLINAEPEPEPEVELDLIDFNNEIQEDDSYSTPLTDHGTRKVDQDDLDILNSLIDTGNKPTAGTDDGLMDELDNINKTLSDTDGSLDDEFTGSGDSSLDDFDNLENGNDLLAELEELEKDFVKNEQLPEGSSLDDSLSVEDSLPVEDSLSIDEIQVTAPGSYSTAQTSIDEEHFGYEESSTGKNSAVNNEPSVFNEPLTEHTDEEVVPSFLTQSNAASSDPSTMFGWLAGTVVLLLILFGQYLHVNSINFAQNQTFRPLLETLCPITGCALPLVKAPRKIITVKHDIHTHPKLNNSLEILLTFKNKASFTQGYPILEIIFSNPRGEVVARRRFLPDEYLSGDIQHIHGLKANQSQDVKLKVVDPDPGSLLSFQFNYF